MQKIILDLISHAGYISLDDFLFQAMCHPIHGYYAKSNPIQRDFTTSPHITNAFGIVIASYIIEKILTINNIDAIETVNLIEFGGGTGQLAFDILSFITSLNKLNNKKINSLIKKINFNSIEFSEKLTDLQKNKINSINIPKYFFKNINDLLQNKNNKNIINIFYSNEFFDALPIKQFICNNKEYYEIIITEENSKLIFSKIKINNNLMPINYFKYQNIPENSIIEFPQTAINILDNIISIMKRSQSLFLAFDYGFTINNYISTLQGIFLGNKTLDILENIGDTDITHLINFELFAEVFTKNDCIPKIYTQANFLKENGIESLMTVESQAAIERLINENAMGELFKVLTVCTLE